MKRIHKRQLCYYSHSFWDRFFYIMYFNISAYSKSANNCETRNWACNVPASLHWQNKTGRWLVANWEPWLNVWAMNKRHKQVRIYSQRSIWHRHGMNYCFFARERFSRCHERSFSVWNSSYFSSSHGRLRNSDTYWAIVSVLKQYWNMSIRRQQHDTS